jgi:hypothetical protein
MYTVLIFLYRLKMQTSNIYIHNLLTEYNMDIILKIVTKLKIIFFLEIFF